MQDSILNSTMKLKIARSYLYLIKASFDSISPRTKV
jgi:hypothetical protein